MIYFFVICILAILKVLPYENMFLSILIIFGLIYYSVRTYLENDAMIKAKFLAKEYMQEVKISDNHEIDKILSKYEELNDVGIKVTNFQFLSKVLIKTMIFIIILMIF